MRVTRIDTVRWSVNPNVLVVRVHTDEGIVGLGEAFFGSRTVETYLHETAAPALFQLRDASPEAAARALNHHVGFQGSGAETRGNGAIDLALWDALGRRSGLSVAELLGGPARSQLDVYNTCAGPSYVKSEARQTVANWGVPDDGADLEYEDLDAFLHRPGELAKDLWEAGFRAMKVWPFDIAAEQTGGTHIDPRGLAFGVDVIAQIHDSVPDMGILVELHGLWNLPSAIRIARALEAFEPIWIEDPLRSDDWQAYRQLRSAVSTPIATGEVLTGQRSFRSLLQHEAIDVAIVDPGWCGGITVARKVASLADSFNTPFAPHDCTGPILFNACVHLAASQPNAMIQEVTRAFRHTWYREMVTGLAELNDGRVAVPDRSGLGVELVDGFLERRDVSVSTSTA